MKHHETRLASVNQAESGNITKISELSAAARDGLIAFVALLTRWNPTVKLVSDHDIGDLQTRHMEDALQLAALIPLGTTQAVDLGSGGGFPGLVLAIATGVHFDLVEADGRKAAFLREAVAITKAPATVHASRIEDLALKSRTLVTARALAPLPKLLELSMPFLAESGVCLFPKGERVTAEIAEADKYWVMNLQKIPSRTSPIGRILRITNLRRRQAVAL